MSKVMVVEDDASLREIYSIRITAEGYDVVSAGDGEEALAVAVREKPDLIIADVMMPKISGFDMLDILRSTPEIAHIKVIMMTALSGDNQRERGESLGADRYLVKSQVGIEDMVNTVHEVLGDRDGTGPVDSPASADSLNIPSNPTPAAATPSVPAPAAPSPQPVANPTVPPVSAAPSVAPTASPAAPVSPSTPPASQPFTLSSTPAPKNWSLRSAPETPNAQPGQPQ